jgi:hypothetical protein
MGDDHVGLGLDEVGCEAGEPLVAAFREAALPYEGLPFDPPARAGRSKTCSTASGAASALVLAVARRERPPSEIGNPFLGGEAAGSPQHAVIRHVCETDCQGPRSKSPQYHALWTGTPFAIGVIAVRRSEVSEITIYRGS